MSLVYGHGSTRSFDTEMAAGLKEMAGSLSWKLRIL